MGRCLRWMLKSQSSLSLLKPCLKVTRAVTCVRLCFYDASGDVEVFKTSVLPSDLGMDDEGDDDPVPLPNVNAAILKKVKHQHLNTSSFSL